MNDLQVPYGIAPDGKIIPADRASRGTDYICPGCRSKLIFRAGTIRAWHFAHDNDGACAYESLLHKTAKGLIAQVITENAVPHDSPGQIRIARTCTDCGNPHATIIPPKTFSSAKQEVGVDGFICDVIGYRGSEMALAIEIAYTHWMSDKKTDALNIRWAELKAADVLASPYYWKPVRENLLPYKCTRCANLRAKNPKRPLAHLESNVRNINRR